MQTRVESWQINFAKVLQYLEKRLLEILKSSVFKCLSSSHELDEQSFKKTIEHKTVLFLGHMNDNSNFTFPKTSTIPRRWPLQNYTEVTVKENPKFHVFGNFGY